jgi:hypothetical protein
MVKHEVKCTAQAQVKQHKYSTSTSPAKRYLSIVFICPSIANENTSNSVFEAENEKILKLSIMGMST